MGKDQSEILAEKYLQTLGLGQVVYEPDGNRPPDFIVGENIAVEVRRLNQNVEVESGFEGLETIEAALVRYIEGLLPRYGPSCGESWWVSYTFRRPISLKALRPVVKRALEEFRYSLDQQPMELKCSPTFKLSIDKASIPLPNYFMLGGYSDMDAGGFIAAEIIRNVEICVGEKTKKASLYRDRYPHWWLILVDRIGPGLNLHERDELRGTVVHPFWERVILLDPRGSVPPVEI